MRDLGDLDGRLADPQARAGWEVLEAQVEVDEELIAGKPAPVRVACDQRGGAGVHQRQLHLGVGRTVVG